MKFNCSHKLNSSRCCRSATGFTLIEIVMVLVLLGILSAVAVPKYFDLQEEAIAKKCQHNRGVVQSSVITQYAAAQLDGTAGTVKWDKKIDEVMKDLGGDDCKKPYVCSKLCEAGGQYDVEFAPTAGGENLTVTVTCRVHSNLDSSDTNNAGTKVIPSAAESFLEWIKNNYQLSEKWGTGATTDLDDFFTKYAGGHGAVDSEANYDETISALMKKALSGQFDTDSVIWRIERAPGEVVKDADGSGRHYETELIVTIANKPEAPGTVAEAYEYRVKVRYGEKGASNEKDVQSWGDVSDPVKRTDLTVKEVTRDGHSYLILVTGNGADADKW